MNNIQDDSTEQARIWTGTGAQAWVEAQELLDQALKPMEDLLADAVRAASATHMLDVGCGTGATTVAAARCLGAGGRCLGVDISQAMIDAARIRAERQGVPARFIFTDAQTHLFERATFDMIISRFGVMFFGDPIQAFTNLHRAAASGAELRCMTWRAPSENPFMTAAEQAAEPLLPGVSRRIPNEPGQFGLADRTRVQDILGQSGWRRIGIAPVDAPCAFPASALELYLSRLGPVGRALEGKDDQTRSRVMEVVRPAFDSYLHGDEVRFTAACWMISAMA